MFGFAHSSTLYTALMVGSLTGWAEFQNSVQSFEDCELVLFVDTNFDGFLQVKIGLKLKVDNYF